MSKAGVAQTKEFRKPRKRKKVILEERVIDNEIVLGKKCTKCDEWRSLEDGFYNKKDGLGGKQPKCKECCSESNGVLKIVKLTERFIDGSLKGGKECTKCGVWNPLEGGFYKQKGGLGNKSSQCKECREKSNGIWKEKNKEKIKRTLNKWYIENKEAILEKSRDWHEKNKERKAELMRKWRQGNPEKIKLKDQKRRARKKALPDDFTYEQLTEVLKQFDYGCALTGYSDIHWDHVIPLSIGHRGTTHGNMIPLRSDLNMSKKDNNIFEWFETNRQRFELSQAKFDRLIEWLAAANEMTVEEYRDYVNWCHAHPNDVLESEAI